MKSFSIKNSENKDWRTTTSRFFAGIAILAGVLFLLSSSSDIQLGFGLVLLLEGLINIFK